MSIKKVMVVGSGLMGSGITQVCAQAGIGVFIYDVSQDALERAMENNELPRSRAARYQNEFLPY